MIYEGLAYFNPHTTCQQVNQLMNATIQATIQTDRWKIDGGKYCNEKWKHFLAMVQKVDARILHLFQNDEPSILMQVHTISFPNLKSLWLSNNQIESIEILCTMDAPALQSIRINHNKIVTFKTLKKCHFQTLSHLALHQNHSMNLEQFTQISSSRNMEVMDLEISQRDQLQGNDLGWANKAPFHIKFFNICSNQRIKNGKMESMLRHKQKNIKIHSKFG